jgi:hypothetical protein
VPRSDAPGAADTDLIGDAAAGDVVAADAGPGDVPPADLGPDTGITDRGFGSFPLPSFDTGFGKPR